MTMFGGSLMVSVDDKAVGVYQMAWRLVSEMIEEIKQAIPEDARVDFYNAVRALHTVPVEDTFRPGQVSRGRVLLAWGTT